MKTALTPVLLALALAAVLAAGLAGGSLCGPVAAMAAAPAAPRLAVPAGAASIMTWDGQRDVGALMAEAHQTWNLADQDAVILLDEARMTYAEDGRLRQERHRVVWIFTDWAVDNFADLRVPWDSERQKLTVQALRVWRDGRWIAARPTAVVETTPFALRSAPDYTGIRETMLLHDGVELPCVLECDYVIEDTVAPNGWTGWEDGQWIFPQAVPVVESRIVLEAPAAKPLTVRAAAGSVVGLSAEPETCDAVSAAAPKSPGLTAACYRLRQLPPSPLPAIDDPASILPHVQWSTFADWESFGKVIDAGFGRELDLGPALRDSVKTLVKDAYSEVEEARRIVDFVRRSMRRIEYDGRFFPVRARPVDRVFETAYGSDLDLARLARALFQEVGIRVAPTFVGLGPGEIDERVPTLARMRFHGLRLFKTELSGLYWEAAGGALRSSGADLHGRALWSLERFSPAVYPGVPPGMVADANWTERACEAACRLRWDDQKKGWAGEGRLRAWGIFDPSDEMNGSAAAARQYLDSVVAGVVTGLSVQDYSPWRLEGSLAEVNFDLKSSAAARDTLGRLPVVIGSPTGGLQDALPHDVDLSQAERGAPVRLPCKMKQVVRVTLTLGGLEVVRLPEPAQLTNDAGSFELAVERDGQKVTIIRTTRLTQMDVAPSQWPALRELLLAEADPGHRTVLLR